MHALIAPPIGRALVPVALDNLPATAPEGLEGRAHRARHAIRALGGPHALDLGTLVVVRDETAPIVVLDLNKVFMTAHS